MPVYKVLNPVQYQGKTVKSGTIEVLRDTGDRLVARGYLEEVKERVPKETKELKTGKIKTK